MITKINSYGYYPKFTANKTNNNIIAINREPFTRQTLQNLANLWSNQNLLQEGDSIIIIPKESLYEAAKIDKKIAGALTRFKLSGNGFAAAIYNEDGHINTKGLQFFDPKTNTILQLVHQIQNNKVYIVPLQAEYLE